MTQSSSARRFLLPLVPVYRLGLALRELQLGIGLEHVRRLRFPWSASAAFQRADRARRRSPSHWHRL